LTNPLTNLEKANKDQYALLFGHVYPYVLDKLGYPVTHSNIMQLHEEFKKHLEYDSISGVSQGLMQRYIWEVYASSSMELGIYIPEPDQPSNAELLPLELLWKK